MIKQESESNPFNMQKQNTNFKTKRGLQSSLMSRKTKEQILKVSGDVTHYCVLGYN